MRFTNVLVALLPAVVHAALPLSKQHPLIARVNQPYSWTISPLTFDNADFSTIFLRDRTSPDWLTYDNATSTFRGTPTPKDIGITTVRIRNQSGEADRFQLCVTDLPPPVVNIPLESQLVPGNPSISSGFTFSAPNIGVRVPPKWSFSIGFDGFTFTTPDERNVYYDATLVNGLPLPGWIVFNNRTLTFDGVAPPMNQTPKLSIVLHGSDRWGFGAIQAQFDLVIGPRTHLLGVDGIAGLETVNVTGGTPFGHSIKTFGGLTIDGVPVVAANISRVEVDVSSVPWVVFDSSNRVLSGLPPLSAIGRSNFILPVSITSDYNDTVNTIINLAVFPSYFVSTPILPVAVKAGAPIMFSLEDYIASGHSTPTTIVPEYVPRIASSWLSYDDSNNILRGTVPQSTSYNEVNVTFSAINLETHAVSTASLLLSISYNATHGPEVWEHRQGRGVNHRAKSIIVAIFSVIGGAILLCCLLALCRRFCGAREPREGDESSSQWKGQHATQLDTRCTGPMEKMVQSIELGRASDETVTSEDRCKLPLSVIVPPGSHNVNPGPPPAGKGARIFDRLIASSKWKFQDQSLGSQSSKIRRSQISRPALVEDKYTLEHAQDIILEGGVASYDAGKNLIKYGVVHIPGRLSNAPSSEWSRAEPKVQEGLPRESSAQVMGDRHSQVLSESDESSLTSIPRRRSDFLPPRDQRQRMEGSEQYRNIASGPVRCIPPSGSSGTINNELREDAIIVTAARQVLPSVVSSASVDRSVVRSSMDSARSATLNQNQSSPSSPGSLGITGIRRPRLVQLNSERRVPTSNEGASTSRNRSQKAVISSTSRFSTNSNESYETEQDKRLSLGIRYLPSLGDGVDAGSAVFYMTPSVGVTPSPVVGLGKSPALLDPNVESSVGPPLLGPGVNNSSAIRKGCRQSRIPIGAPFAISVPFEIIPARGAELSVRQQDGKPIPAWIKFDQRDVELWGVPLKEHLGIHLLEILEGAKEGERVVARMSVEVVEWE
ncbi:unnamed protein product [Rhizoctonia solani]|uniref:Dystroglycan-type cadherin-like domain-containing protein n=1 Tax=Rhizoctonia solani TaxID=456999 RepID=A0A8H3GBJ4_9AGAM|nr:unnamed protein product [Rhizoctonia solani]